MFLLFISKDGTPFYISKEKIIAMVPTEAGNTCIYVGAGEDDYFLVAEDLDAVLDKLRVADLEAVFDKHGIARG